MWHRKAHLQRQVYYECTAHLVHCLLPGAGLVAHSGCCSTTVRPATAPEAPSAPLRLNIWCNCVSGNRSNQVTSAVLHAATVCHHTTYCLSLHTVCHYILCLTTYCLSLHTVCHYILSVTTYCVSLHTVCHYILSASTYWVSVGIIFWRQFAIVFQICKQPIDLGIGLNRCWLGKLSTPSGGKNSPLRNCKAFKWDTSCFHELQMLVDVLVTDDSQNG